MLLVLVLVLVQVLARNDPHGNPAHSGLQGHAALYAEIWYTHLRVVQFYAADHFTGRRMSHVRATLSRDR